MFTDIQIPTVVPNGAYFVQADSSDKAAMEHAAQVAVDRFGGIDALFCNSGIHRRNTILDISQEELDLIIRTRTSMALLIPCKSCCRKSLLAVVEMLYSTRPTSSSLARHIALHMV